MTTQAMFSRTGSSDFPSYLKCMISGPPKSGKTHLLGTVPNIIILDTEPHANNLQTLAHLDVPFKAIHSTNDLRQAHFILNNPQLRQQAAEALGMEKIEAVAIDTVDTLQGIMKRERMRETRQSSFLRDDWGWLKEELNSILEAFLSLDMHVFLIVHTKTKDIGSQENPQTIVLPGLEGAIAESIAGMVGYSLLSFRDEQFKADGTKYTKYWLRAEGNGTYQFLGNRAAGRLPDVIEPDFKHLYEAAMAGRPQNQGQSVQMDFQTTGQIQPPAPEAPAPQAPETPAVPEAPQPPAAPAAPAPAAPAQNSGQPGDEEPMNAAALGHVKKVYDAIGMAFPEDKIKALNLGQARNLVRMYRAAVQDQADGKGEDPKAIITEYLVGQGWDSSPAEATPAVEPKADGTIEQIKAYVGDDLARVQEVYDREVNADKPRSSLLEWLLGKGAQMNAQIKSPTPEAAVTQPEATADDASTEEKAVETVKEALGGEVISQGIRSDALCEECNNPIDDLDLAELGKTRFNRVLCVADYIAETKKPRTT